MYENVTYAELKGFPKEQKTEALKELKTLYKTQKELAGKLGVSPNLLYNMMSRYVKDSPAGSEKAAELGIVEKPEKAGNRVKRQRVQKVQRVQKDQIVQNEQNENVQKQEAVAPDIVIIDPETKDETFSISIRKTVSGEDAQVFLNGIGITLLKGQHYAIELKITER